VRDNASAVTTNILTAQPTAQFGVAEYKDFTDPFPFKVNQDITGDTAAVQAGIGQWVASGGADLPEANLNVPFRTRHRRRLLPGGRKSDHRVVR
jgi:hypothetical protein